MANVSELGEFVGMVILLDLGMFPRRAQILPDRQDVHSRFNGMLHQLRDFVFLFAKTHHNAGFDINRRVHPFRRLQETERRGVVRFKPDCGIETANGFDIVRKDIRNGIDDCPHRVERALKVGREQLDLHIWIEFPNLPHRFGKNHGTSILEIVTINGRDDGVLELQVGNSRGNSCRLHQVILGRAATGHCAKRARARANITEDHERSGSMFAPAFGDVGTHCVFANRIELMGTEDAANLKEVFTTRDSNLQPIGATAHSPPV